MNKENAGLSPGQKEKLELAANMLTDMLYNPKTKDSVIKMIKGAPPEQSIPYAVNAVFDKFESMSKDKIGGVPIDVKLSAGVHLFSEVMEMAESMGLIPEDLGQDKIQGLLRETLKTYIQKGLKDGSIDPIKLQAETEPLLNEEEKKIGLQEGQKAGIPAELQQGQINMALTQNARRPLEMENASLKKSNKGMQSALQGISSQPQQGGM